MQRTLEDRFSGLSDLRGVTDVEERLANNGDY
jgi:hypothetical protein